MTDKLKEVIAKLKNKEQEEPAPAPDPEPTPTPKPEAEPEPPKEELKAEPQEEPKEEDTHAIAERIRDLNNNGVFRLELLLSLSSIDDKLERLAKAIEGLTQ